GRLGRGDLAHAGAGQVAVEVERGLVEGDRGVAAGLVDAADYLRVAAQVAEDAAARDALGAEGEQEVAAGGQAGGGRQPLGQAAAGGPDRQGRLVDDQRAVPEPATDRVGRGVEGTVVDRADLVDDDRDDHDHDLGVEDSLAGRGGGAQAPGRDGRRHAIAEVGLLDDVGLAAVDR